MLWEGLGFLQQIGESFGIRPKANSKRVEQTGCWCLRGPKPAGPGCYLARPGQFRNRETTLLKILDQASSLPKKLQTRMQKGAQETHNCFAILEHKPDHQNSKNQHKKKHKPRAQKKAQEHHNCFATQSTNPTTNSKNQHKHRKHKLEHKKKAQETPQLFCNPEHKPDHKLQKPAQRKKHKLEHKQKHKNTTTVLQPRETKPDHKLQKPAQEKAQTRMLYCGPWKQPFVL